MEKWERRKCPHYKESVKCKNLFGFPIGCNGTDIPRGCPHNYDLK